jgi:hypothetical protein
MFTNPSKRKRRRVRNDPNPGPRRRKRRSKRRRRNPSPRFARARRYARAAGGRMFSGLSFRGALKDVVSMELGVLAARFAKKRFGPDANDYDPATWTVWSDVKGVVGAVLGGMLANAIKPGMGQKVMTGGMLYITDRIVRNNLINKSDWAIAQFGADDEGIVVDEQGIPYAQTGGNILPLNEVHRYLPQGSAMGDSLVSPSALGASRLVPVGRLGDEDYAAYSRRFGR